MTRFTTNAYFGHRGFVSIRDQIIVFAQPGVVAGSAHRIPGHASSRPMTPLAWFSILVSANIKPILPSRVEGQLGALESASRRPKQKLAHRPDTHNPFSRET